MPRRFDTIDLTLTREQVRMVLVALKQSTVPLSFPRKQRELERLIESALLEGDPMPRKTDSPKTSESGVLKRLEEWMLTRKRGERNWVDYIELIVGKDCLVRLDSSTQYFTGRGKTLSGAIHDALDKAEVARGVLAPYKTCKTCKGTRRLLADSGFMMYRPCPDCAGGKKKESRL